MNIIEAIKSGKRFKRKREVRWVEDPRLQPYHFHEVIADDWEIEEKKVEITKGQFWHAYAVARKLVDEYASDRNFVPVVEIMVKELGLED